LLLLILTASRWTSTAALQPVWLALVLAGIFLRAWAGRHIGLHSNGPRMEAGPLAGTGPYRRFRHPLYGSNLLVAAGLIGFANLSRPLGLSLWAAAFFHHALLMRWEEKVLEPGLRRPPETAPANDSGLWKMVWIRQGRNLAYALAGVFLVALAAKPWR
jgi:protein-S-isoprenylcysteine O-methyltransferase Ste14